MSVASSSPSRLTMRCGSAGRAPAATTSARRRSRSRPGSGASSAACVQCMWPSCSAARRLRPLAGPASAESLRARRRGSPPGAAATATWPARGAAGPAAAAVRTGRTAHRRRLGAAALCRRRSPGSVGQPGRATRGIGPGCRGPDSGPGQPVQSPRRRCWSRRQRPQMRSPGRRRGRPQSGSGVHVNSTGRPSARRPATSRTLRSGCATSAPTPPPGCPTPQQQGRGARKRRGPPGVAEFLLSWTGTAARGRRRRLT
jgi:hypothetical protein